MSGFLGHRLSEVANPVFPLRVAARSCIGLWPMAARSTLVGVERGLGVDKNPSRTPASPVKRGPGDRGALRRGSLKLKWGPEAQWGPEVRNSARGRTGALLEGAWSSCEMGALSPEA